MWPWNHQHVLVPRSGGRFFPWGEGLLRRQKFGAAQKVLAFRAPLPSAVRFPSGAGASDPAQTQGFMTGLDLLEPVQPSGNQGSRCWNYKFPAQFILESTWIPSGPAIWSCVCLGPSLAPQHCQGKGRALWGRIQCPGGLGCAHLSAVPGGFLSRAAFCLHQSYGAFLLSLGWL